MVFFWLWRLPCHVFNGKISRCEEIPCQQPSICTSRKDIADFHTPIDTLVLAFCQIHSCIFVFFFILLDLIQVYHINVLASMQVVPFFPNKFTKIAPPRLTYNGIQTLEEKQTESISFTFRFMKECHFHWQQKQQLMQCILWKESKKTKRDSLSRFLCCRWWL